MKTEDLSDWDRVKREAAADAPIAHDDDDLYDPNDEQAVAAFFAQATVVRRRGERGPQKAPVKSRVTLRLSPEVVDYFKASGSGWQTRLDQALKEYVVEHPRPIG
ncbi:BrnA antitoxin family protein [Pseudomonas sp. dw_358]|uniref:BrnA antitoxin family protein n=1 Tax=Pseudomonas sp. dw_358 TaxID=2720083 RepID=UPI001BD1C7EA|nr:BrnA antitoxin family protein [Pseudomonas sp. dw_358]